MKKISLLLAFVMLLSFAACAAPAAETTLAAPQTETPAATPEMTPEPTPEPTPTPVPFSYEIVFSEIFSDEALAELYPDNEDYDRERARISANIARIEDFEFYELTEEEQKFIKEAQSGNVDSSEKSKLSGLLTKILTKDPYVFDDVDNEVKIDNRAKKLSPCYKKTYLDPNDPDREIYDTEEFYESLKAGLRGNNCGRVADPKNAQFTLCGFVSLNYFIEEIYPELKSGKWRGNYYTFEFYQILLDGSEGQKLAKKLYEDHVKFYNSSIEDFDKNFNEFVDSFLQALLINDVLGRPDGIKSISSKSHRAVIYCYLFYYVRWLIAEYKPNHTYIVPKEYAEAVGLSKTKLDYNDIYLIIDRYANLTEMYDSGLSELSAAQSKYGSVEPQIDPEEEIVPKEQLEKEQLEPKK